MVIVFALLAALSNAVNVTTQHMASTSDPRRSSGWRLVLYLFRNPLWLFGWVALAAAFVFQALALHLGLVSVVQPLLATELVFVLVLRRFWVHQSIRQITWGAAGLTCVGLGVFIVAGEPRGGYANPVSHHWLAAVQACGIGAAVDLGMINDRVFVNNASFGAYAEVVESPAYRDDKLDTTLNLLPDLLQGHRGARLVARVDDVEIDAPQAVLVANNPYGTGDIAGLGRRARLDRGTLGVIGVMVSSARQAVDLLRGRHGNEVTVLTTKKIEITADVAEIPVGVDGESLSVPVPVICTIRPRALRVWVPRDRPGIPAPKPPMDWARLRQLAGFGHRRPEVAA